METISREDLIGDYDDMMKSEAHHNHEIIKDKNGIIQWKPDPLIELIIDAYGITKILDEICALGGTKNGELYRELYRKRGYPLSGYWEIFYCELNNPDAPLYIPNTKI